jgi:hypothetical protein
MMTRVSEINDRKVTEDHMKRISIGMTDVRKSAILRKGTMFICITATKPGPSNNFYFKWSGPFRVTDKLSDLNYELLGHHERKFIVHVHRLKLCQGTVKQKPNPVPKWRRKTKHKGDNLSRVNQETEISRSAISSYSLVRDNSLDRGSLSAPSSTIAPPSSRVHHAISRQ